MTMYYKKKEMKLHVGLKQLADELSASTGLSIRSSREVISILIEIIINHLAAGRGIHLDRFGVWTFRYRKGRTVVWKNHIRTGESLKNTQASRWCVMWKPSVFVKRVANHLCEEPPKIGKASNGVTIPSGPVPTEPPKPNLGSPTPPLPEPSIRIPSSKASAAHLAQYRFPAGSRGGTASSKDSGSGTAGKS